MRSASLGLMQPPHLSLVTLPDQILRAPTARVSFFDDELRQLVASMRALMHAAEGVGLAAPQIGRSIKLAVIEYEPLESPDGAPDKQPAISFLALANPTITQLGKTYEVYDEGCLSVPDLQTPIPRATEISILADNLDGQRIRIRAKGLLARILQHEIDHLNGLLIVDRTIDRKIRKEYQSMPEISKIKNQILK